MDFAVGKLNAGQMAAFNAITASLEGENSAASGMFFVQGTAGSGEYSDLCT